MARVRRAAARGTTAPSPPEYLKYHLSLTEELHALRDRIKNLVSHRLTSGEHRESALRTMLRRHLPPTLIVGRGFVVTEHAASEQIDILVVDSSYPALYRDGDLMIVTPDAVRAIVEVKTVVSLTGRGGRTPQINAYIQQLAQKGSLCEKALAQSRVKHKIWTGLFIYNGKNEPYKAVLEAIAAARHATDHCVNCVSFGKRDFFRYWTKEEIDKGALGGYAGGAAWHSYGFDKDISASYFIGNMIDAIATITRLESSFAWFPIIVGKEPFQKLRLIEENLQIKPRYIGVSNID